jgi:hypothetical protein
MENTVLVHIGTGKTYCEFFPPLLESAKKFFSPHETLIFTDSNVDFGVTKQVHLDKPDESIGPQRYPNILAKRYNIISSEGKWLSQFENILYMDTDVVFVDYVKAEDVFVDGITVMTHPWPAVEGDKWKSPYESRPESAAYVDGTDYQTYYQGCVAGGRAFDFLKLAETIARNVDADEEKGIVAEWLDESYLNQYAYIHPPAKVLPSTFCYPRHFPKVDGIKAIHINAHSAGGVQKAPSKTRERTPAGTTRRPLRWRP